MSMESELIKSLDEIAFEEGTNNINKLQAMQNLLYQYEANLTAASLRAEEEEFPNSRRI